MYAQHFEEFTEGDVYRPPARTITEADVVGFTALSGDANPVHTDVEFAAGTPFERPIAHGLLGLACAGGFLSRVGVIDGTAVAMLGVEWRFAGPVSCGDTIAATIAVTDVRPTSRPDAGLVRFSFEVRNQRDEVVQTGSQTFLMRRQGPDAC